jgi:hypothetical protein
MPLPSRRVAKPIAKPVVQPKADDLPELDLDGPPPAPVPEPSPEPARVDVRTSTTVIRADAAAIDAQLDALAKRTTLEDLARAGKKNLKTLSERQLKEWIREALTRVISSTHSTVSNEEQERMLAATRAELGRLMSESGSAASEKEALEAQIAQLKTDRMTLAGERDGLFARVADLERRLDAAAGQIADAEALAAGAEGEEDSGQLREELERLYARVAAAESERGTLKKTLAQRLVSGSAVSAALLELDELCYGGRHLAAAQESASGDEAAFYADEAAAKAVADALARDLPALSSALAAAVPTISEPGIEADRRRVARLVDEASRPASAPAAAPAAAPTGELQERLDEALRERDQARMLAEAAKRTVAKLIAKGSASTPAAVPASAPSANPPLAAGEHGWTWAAAGAQGLRRSRFHGAWSPAETLVPGPLRAGSVLTTQGGDWLAWQTADGAVLAQGPDRRSYPLATAGSVPSLAPGRGAGSCHIATTTGDGAVLVSEDGAPPADLTARLGCPRAAGAASAWWWSRESSRHIAYRGADGTINELLDLDGTWYHASLSAHTGCPAAASDPVGYAPGDREHVLFRSVDGSLHELCFDQGRWLDHDLTAAAGAPRAVGSPSGAYVAGQHWIAYRAADGGLHLLRLGGDWRHLALNRLGGASGDPILSGGAEAALAWPTASGWMWARLGREPQHAAAEALPS